MFTSQNSSLFIPTNHEDILRHVLVESTSDHFKYKKLSEAQKSDLTNDMITKLLFSIKNKAIKVHYKLIEDTKGDVTKLKNFSDLQNVINFLYNMSMKESKAPKKEISDLRANFVILQKYKDDFMTGYKSGREMVMYTYSTILATVIQASAYLLSITIDYSKGQLGTISPEFRSEFNKKELEHSIAFTNMARIAAYDKSGKFSSFLKNLNNASGVTGFGAGVALAVGTIILILFTIRELLFLVYYLRTELSNYLEMHSKFVSLNASSLRSGNQAEIRKEQQATANQLARIADSLVVDTKVANKQANKEVQYENKDIKAEVDKQNQSYADDLLL